MKFLVPYSGLIGSFFATFFICFSAILGHYDKKKRSISYTGILPFWSFFFNSGAILSGIFQVIFIFFLTTKLLNQINLGTLIYAVGGVCCSLVGLITLKRNRKIHIYSAIGFFIFNSIGGILFSLSLLNINYNLAITTSIFAFIEIISTFLVYKIIKETGFSELIGILFSVLWAVSFYLIK